MSKFNLNRFLTNSVRPALGCTEIVVIGLASALAYQAAQNKIPKYLQKNQNKQNFSPLLLGQLTKITIKVDRNVFKNAKAVAIPMPDNLIADLETGIEFAATLGLFCDLDNFKASDILTLFSNVDADKSKKAKCLKEKVPIKIEVVNNQSNKAELFVEVKLDFIKPDSTTLSKQKFGLARLEHNHSHVTLLSNDQHDLYQAEQNLNQNQNVDKDLVILAKLSLKEMIALCQNLSIETKKLLKKNIQMNLDLAKKGLEGKHGMKLGINYQKMIAEKILSDDLINKTKIIAAAACDARMGGAMKPAMSTAGSGNQGITASIPIITTAQETKYDEEKLFQALTLSHLVTSYIAYYSGHLSALCGCAVKAGVGAAAGVAYYLSDGDYQTIVKAINNMIANITGMICDGAKIGCALKLSTASGAAIESALLAMRGVAVPTNNGILHANLEQSLQHIGEVSNSMVITDQVMVDRLM